LRTFERLVLWGLHPNLIFWFLGTFSKPDLRSFWVLASSSIPEYLVLNVQIVALDSV